MTYKYGKLPATRPFGVSDLSVYADGKMPSPPPSVDFYTGLSLPIDANDQYGDCVMAAVAHLIEAWNDEVKEPDAIPTSDEVVAEYFKLTGGADSGLNESSTLTLWHRQGLFGHKIAAFAPLDVRNILAIHQAVAFYGGAMFGIQCPESAQEDFAAGQPWTYDPSSPVDGGHAIAPLGYDQHYVYCATWGGVAPVTYPFLGAYLDEAYAIIPNEFVEAGRGPKLDLKTLQADLSRI